MTITKCTIVGNVKFPSGKVQLHVRTAHKEPIDYMVTLVKDELSRLFYLGQITSIGCVDSVPVMLKDAKVLKVTTLASKAIAPKVDTKEITIEDMTLPELKAPEKAEPIAEATEPEPTPAPAPEVKAAPAKKATKKKSPAKKTAKKVTKKKPAKKHTNLKRAA